MWVLRDANAEAHVMQGRTRHNMTELARGRTHEHKQARGGGTTHRDQHTCVAWDALALSGDHVA